MSYKPLRELMEMVHRVHCTAADCCAEISDDSDERARLTADFFRQRQHSLGEHLKSLSENEATPVLEAWVQYTPTRDVDDALAELRAARAQDLSMLTEKCVGLQHAIIDLLRQLAENVKAPSVQEALADLAAFEEKATRELARATLTDHDV